MKIYDAVFPPWYTFLYQSMSYCLISYIIASDQFVNIVYMLLLNIIYLIGLSEWVEK